MLAAPEFAEWLRALREARSVPLRIVGAKAGLDSTLLSKFERGERLPTDVQADALAAYYKVRQGDMRSRLIAARILRDHGADPTLDDAITLVREHAAAPRKYLRKPVTYSGRRRPKR